jgi:hypothetical protein
MLHWPASVAAAAMDAGIFVTSIVVLLLLLHLVIKRLLHPFLMA